MRIRTNPLDVLFSQLMRKKKPRCEVCGKLATQVHHWKGRRCQSVRYDPDNAWCVCFTCHRKFEEDAHFAVEMQKRRLGDRYDAFILKANSICKRTNSDKVLLKIWMMQEMKQCS